jgi:hypothetical protein
MLHSLEDCVAKVALFLMLGTIFGLFATPAAVWIGERLGMQVNLTWIFLLFYFLL